ncbi:hypothetical protein ACLB2K_007565 [Fragaria x ananassa]
MEFRRDGSQTARSSLLPLDGISRPVAGPGREREWWGSERDRSSCLGWPDGGERRWRSPANVSSGRGKEERRERIEREERTGLGLSPLPGPLKTPNLKIFH